MVDQTSTLLRNGRLSMRKVVAHALGLLVRNAGPIALTMIGPVVVMTLIRELVPAGFGAAPGTALVTLHGVSVFVVWLLLWVGFASVLHARFLDHGRPPPPWRALIWSHAQVSFLFGIVRLIGVLILVGMATFLLGYVAGEIAGLIGLIAGTIVWGRLAMVFPSAAVGRPLALADSWRLTGLARVRVVILIGSLYICAQFFGPIVVVLPLFDGEWLLQILSAVLLFFGAAIVAAVLSATYRGLVEMRPADVRDTYVPQDQAPEADAP